jgi:hypothetical protein
MKISPGSSRGTYSYPQRCGSRRSRRSVFRSRGAHSSRPIFCEQGWKRLAVHIYPVKAATWRDLTHLRGARDLVAPSQFRATAARRARAWFRRAVAARLRAPSTARTAEDCDISSPDTVLRCPPSGGDPALLAEAQSPGRRSGCA